MARSRLKGFEEFQFTLKRLPINVQKRVLKTATRRALRLGYKEILATVPRSFVGRSPASKKYGFARDNIRLFSLKRPTTVNGKKSVGSRVNTGDAFWLVFYELGTRYQPARPFFANAIARTQEKMFTLLGKYLAEGIAKETRKLVRNKK